MKSQWTIIGIVFGLLVVLVGMGWSVRERFLPVEVGSEAPANFTSTDMTGAPVNLDDLRGEVILLNIWATWCPPCREEMPSMQRLHEQLADEGVHIVAVSIDAPDGTVDPAGNPGGNVEAFARQMGLTFPIWLNQSGDIQRAYRTTGVPESFVIDRNGVIVKKVIGPTEWDSEANIALFRRLLES